MTAKETAQRIIELAQEKKGRQIVLMDMEKLSSFVQYFVIISGDSSLHIKAIADHIVDGMKEHRIRPYGKEGYEFLHWVLLDYIDVVVHIFDNETREFYAIERLWADAKMEFITDEES
ncbi:MAG TPA: ribosome silencing factor [Caldithrix abyssi]|uniref:Ribosomal silencing factor RsfS n=2 Tax=Caldithrix abyssi TaxID=187145 RepID=A0A7V5PR69_CALAY|nr:ribosome silencing factor [Caldithrix abyssi]